MLFVNGPLQNELLPVQEDEHQMLREVEQRVEWIQDPHHVGLADERKMASSVRLEIVTLKLSRASDWLALCF